MHRLGMFVAIWIVAAAIFSACAAPMAAPSEPAPDNISATPLEEAQPSPQPQDTIDIGSLEPQRIEFQSGDGTRLVGTYWPPVEAPAPGIVLMHMMGNTKESWQPLPALLQGAGMAHEGAQRQSYAVLAFDFRGHGESEGDAGSTDGLLQDAQAALSTMRAMPEVDPERIVLIGASIGADAAVDACEGGCIGAISLSPGSYLGPNYNAALVALGDKSALCVASEDDHLPAQTCEGGRLAGLNDYQLQIYTGGYHGTDLFGVTDQQPLLTDLIFEWLYRVMMN